MTPTSSNSAAQLREKLKEIFRVMIVLQADLNRRTLENNNIDTLYKIYYKNDYLENLECLLAIAEADGSSSAVNLSVL